MKNRMTIDHDVAFPHQLMIDVFTLQGDELNYNKHPKSQIDALVTGLRRFGQRKPIVIRNKNGVPTIVAGEGLTLAFRQLAKENLKQWGTIWAVMVPEDWDEETARGYLVADNRMAQLANPDNETLVELIERQMQQGYDILSLGFTQQTYADLVASTTTLDDVASSPAIDASLTQQLVYANDAIAKAAFTYFRSGGFPYRTLPLYICMQELNKLAQTETERLLQSTVGYGIADTYHRHRFSTPVIGMKTPTESFQDDDLLKHTLHLFQELTGSIPKNILSILSLVRGTQACANFRPGFALYLYRKYCREHAVVLDTSTGFGGRLVGFMASGFAGTYIGIDPNTVTHEANMKMVKDLRFASHVELINKPAEDVSLEMFAECCDFAFTSPPYFAKEQYSEDDTQSWKRYKTGEAWRQGFLQKMLALQYASLKPGTYSVINIADVTIKNMHYPLVDWTIQDGKAAGFQYIETQEYSLKHRLGAGHDEDVVTEPVIVFRKPEKHNADTMLDVVSTRVQQETQATKRIKVSAASAHMMFHPCTPEYIAAICHGRCCERGGVAALISVTSREALALEKRGATIQNNMIVGRASDKKCFFKTSEHLCGLHGTGDKPFGCIASPFTLHATGDTLIVRYRYTSLVCHDETRMGGSLPAYKAFRSSLDMIFGKDEAQHICDKLDRGSGDFFADMPVSAYETLRSNDAHRKALKVGVVV